MDQMSQYAFDTTAAAASKVVKILGGPTLMIANISGKYADGTAFFVAGVFTGPVNGLYTVGGYYYPDAHPGYMSANTAFGVDGTAAFVPTNSIPQPFGPVQIPDWKIQEVVG